MQESVEKKKKKKKKHDYDGVTKRTSCDALSDKVVWWVRGGETERAAVSVE